MDIAIAKGQKKILIVSAVVIGVFLIFHIFIYRPARNSMRSLKAELEQVEARIEATRAIIGRDRPLAEGFSMLQRRFDEVSRLFPQSEEETLQAISALAYKSGLNISSIKPKSLREYLDNNGNTVRIGKEICRQIPLALSGQATYRKLGTFLEALREEAPALLAIEKLRISKGPEKYGLSVDMDLRMYLLRE